MKKTNIKTSTYDYGDGYMVDIVESDTMYESYIYRPKANIKTLIWGIDKEHSSLEEFTKISENCVFDEIDTYEEIVDKLK